MSTPDATHNGMEYRAIFVAPNLWAADVLLNPPKRKKPAKRKVYKGQTIDEEANIRLIKMVYRDGVSQTAYRLGITKSAVINRIRRFEKRMGYMVFPKGGFTLLTYRGKMLLEASQ